MDLPNSAPIDWEEIIVRLEAFTRSLLKKQKWFRGGGIDFFLKGKEMRDYVYGAIEKYLRNPDKYDQTKGDLYNYLCWNLIRSLVSNDVTSEENKTSRDYFNITSHDPDGDDTPYIDRIAPAIEPMFTDDLDYERIHQYIETQIEGDTIVEEIFLGIYSNGMKRREIIKEFGMSSSDYDNGHRRLETVIRQATANFNPNPATV